MAFEPTSWDQTFDEEIADFDAVSPAWDKTVDAVADFDAEVDADGDLNDHADAAHDGSVGLLYTFDDNNAMHGRADFDAVDQTTACVEFWFNQNDCSWEEGKYLYDIAAHDGTAANQFVSYRVKSSGANLMLFFIYNDAATAQQLTGTWTVTSGWHHIQFFWVASSGAGEDDGFMLVYVDGTLTSYLTGVDNDAQDVDVVYFGNLASNQASPSGSYYMDTIKIDPVGGPFVSKLAAQAGTYGLAVPINETTARYAEFTDPTNETTVTAECDFDPNTLTMTTNSEFAIIQMLDSTTSVAEAILKYDGSNYKIYARILNDAGSWENTAEETITDAVHEIQIIFVASTSAGLDNGQLQLWIDDVIERIVTDVDNDSRNVDTVRYGAVTGLDAGTYGIFYMDDCQWSSDYIYQDFVTFGARYRDYTFNAPQRFTISSNAVVFLARYRNYTFNAPKREDMATAKDIWLEGSPFYVVEGATPKITVPFNWATTITGTPTIEIYKDGSSTDSASTYFPSGSVTTSGASLTSKALAVLVPGKYVIVFNAVVDGVLDCWKLGMVVQKQEALW